MQNLSDKFVEKIKPHSLYSMIFLINPAVCEIMWKNIVQSEMPQVKWSMRTSRRIPNGTNIHSEYVIILHFHCKNGSTNAPQCYVISKLPVVFSTVTDLLGSHACAEH